MNTYLDTRGHTGSHEPFSRVLLQGIAPGGGLYVPRDIPRLTLETIVNMASAPYHRRATTIFEALGVDFDPSQIGDIMVRGLMNVRGLILCRTEALI